jgi:hypothetical protein
VFLAATTKPNLKAEELSLKLHFSDLESISVVVLGSFCVGLEIGNSALGICAEGCAPKDEQKKDGFHVLGVLKGSKRLLCLKIKMPQVGKMVYEGMPHHNCWLGAASKGAGRFSQRH